MEFRVEILHDGTKILDDQHCDTYEKRRGAAEAQQTTLFCIFSLAS